LAISESYAWHGKEWQVCNLPIRRVIILLIITLLLSLLSQVSFVVESYTFYKGDAMYAHGPLGGPTPLTTATIGLFVSHSPGEFMQHVCNCIMGGYPIPRPMFVIDRYHAIMTVKRWFLNNKTWYVSEMASKYPDRAPKNMMKFLLVHVRLSFSSVACIYSTGWYLGTLTL
jgi:hypothetical protein